MTGQENGKLQAFAAMAMDGGSGASFDGLTKREYFAAMAMQGFLSAWPEHAGNILPSSVASYAVSCADELLKALEQ